MKSVFFTLLIILGYAGQTMSMDRLPHKQQTEQPIINPSTTSLSPEPLDKVARCQENLQFASYQNNQVETMRQKRPRDHQAETMHLKRYRDHLLEWNQQYLNKLYNYWFHIISGNNIPYIKEGIEQLNIPVNLTDPIGRTALDHAINQNNVELFELLLAHGGESSNPIARSIFANRDKTPSSEIDTAVYKVCQRLISDQTDLELAKEANNFIEKYNNASQEN